VGGILRGGDSQWIVSRLGESGKEIGLKTVVDGGRKGHRGAAKNNRGRGGAELGNLRKKIW